jgi:hypothetical protein
MRRVSMTLLPFTVGTAVPMAAPVRESLQPCLDHWHFGGTSKFLQQSSSIRCFQMTIFQF